ncbi:transposase [Micromonospora endophytica]|uniref:transposase n=1 Tax=Micromonospora endophytica TaxID=515350 RepID=UPI001C3314BA|nr:hypothetical protein Jiend_17030 [Micromonospora endophytica]
MTMSMVNSQGRGLPVDGEQVAVDGPRLPLSAPALDEQVAKQAARKAVADLVDDRALDAVLAQVKGDGLRLTGPGGFLSELVRAVLERGLRAELTEHLGYGAHDPAGNGSGNSRNGQSSTRSATATARRPLPGPTAPQHGTPPSGQASR